MKTEAVIRDFNVEEPLIKQYNDLGFQASHVGEGQRLLKEITERKGCRLFLSFTANLMASGLRGIFKELVDKGFVDAVVTTGGAIDHDIIKAGKPYLKGDFQLNDSSLKKQDVNRIGNILVPNDRYMFLEENMLEVFKEIQDNDMPLTPSKFIAKTAETIGTEDMFIKKCLDKDVPVYCPGLVDSAIGLQIFMHKQDNPNFLIDDAGDLKHLHENTMTAEETAGFIIGGGISKHHLIGSNLLRGGLDYAIYLTTSSEYDGSLSGATPREAKSWGKIRESADTVTIYGDATVTVPLITYNLLRYVDG